MPNLDTKIADTPKTPILQRIFGPDISVKEALIVAAAVIIIINALAG